jgi:hypothetical protein
MRSLNSTYCWLLWSVVSVSSVTSPMLLAASAEDESDAYAAAAMEISIGIDEGDREREPLLYKFSDIPLGEGYLGVVPAIRAQASVPVSTPPALIQKSKIDHDSDHAVTPILAILDDCNLCISFSQLLLAHQNQQCIQDQYVNLYNVVEFSQTQLQSEDFMVKMERNVDSDTYTYYSWGFEPPYQVIEIKVVKRKILHRRR